MDVLKPHVRDLGGGLMVSRVLPGHPHQMVGPFIFFDQMGPMTAAPEQNVDVRPHPHIGLATVTYLFDGAIVHRDSLGVVQRIEPGAVNWMTAGRGIVHSERRPPDLADRRYTLHGLQLWAALPRASEEVAPSFSHTSAADLPAWEGDGLSLRLLIGDAFGRRSPIDTLMPTLYLDVAAPAGATLTLPASELERAVYSVDARLVVDGTDVPPFTLAVLAENAPATIVAPEGARYVIAGGAKLDGPRFMFWNFVSSSRERIEQAKADWTAQRMGQIPGETEFIPLP
jgi:redox-sensitive bicupin YhaK (pirin superfamily)